MADSEPEDWCFECKDGGDLVVCDHGNCGKVYHMDCVPKEEASFENDQPWICGRHYCSKCHRSPRFYCLGCKHAVCFKCYSVEEFAVVRDGKGLCSDCLELVFIIEYNLDHDSEGNKISLNDRDTYEALFKEYWDIIKSKEGLDSGDVCATLTKYKMDPNSVHHRRFRNTDGSGDDEGDCCSGGGNDEDENDDDNDDEEEEEGDSDKMGFIILDTENELGLKKSSSKPKESMRLESNFAQTKYNKDMVSLCRRRFGESEKERDKDGGKDGNRKKCIILDSDDEPGLKRKRSKSKESIRLESKFPQTKYNKDMVSLNRRRFGENEKERDKDVGEDGNKKKCIILDSDDELGLKRRRSKSKESIRLESNFAQTKYNKDMVYLHRRRFGESEKERDKDGGVDRNKEGCIILDTDHDLGPKMQRYKSEEFVGWELKFAQMKYNEDMNAHERRFGEKKLTPCINNKDDTWKHVEGTARKGFELHENIGWGSKPVIDFLTSIGKDISKPLSRWYVNLLIHEYIDQKNLHHPVKGRFITDEKLFLIFPRKHVAKKKVYSLLKCHIPENLLQIKEEKNDEHPESLTYKLPNNDQPSLSRKTQLKKGDYIAQTSCFASINAENIKLIYLKKSLVRELSKKPEDFADKVIGTFVKILVDPTDHRQRNHYHLVRVIGVNKEFLLQVSFFPKAIAVSDLSDDDITELECETLKQKVKDSLLPKITVEELQAKAICLREDITKHWVAKRLTYLEKRIEYTNDKGRLREKDLLIDEKLELKRPGKINELLRELPKVCPELIQQKNGPDYDSQESDELLFQ